MQSSEPKKDCKPVSATGLLSLPLEVRHEIYRELLLFPEEQRASKLCPEILCANKQIREEGSKVLYEENLWVMLALDLGDMANSPYYKYLTNVSCVSRDILNSDNLRFQRKPAVRLDVRSQQNLWSKLGLFTRKLIANRYAPCAVGAMEDDMKCLLIPIIYVENLIRILSFAFQWREIQDLEFRVCVGAPVVQRRNCQNAILEYLADFRGVRKAVIVGMQPDSINEQSANLMMTPIEHVDEILARCYTYQRRAERAATLGRYKDASDMYKSGLIYLNKAQELFIERHPDISPERVKQQLLPQKMHFLINYPRAVMKKEGGLFDWVLDQEEKVSDFQKALAYYEKGREHKSRGRKITAAFAFLQAYVLRPGWEAVDQELDGLESITLRSGRRPPNLGWYLFSWNLEGLFHGFRYKKRQVA